MIRECHSSGSPQSNQEKKFRPSCRATGGSSTPAACEPEHFLLPANLSRHTKPSDPLKDLSGFDVKRHQKSWDTAWRNLRAAAAQALVDRAKERNRELTKKERESIQRFQRLRFHDLRFTFTTLMAERDVKYYTRISDERQRQAVEAWKETGRTSSRYRQKRQPRCSRCNDVGTLGGVPTSGIPLWGFLWGRGLGRERLAAKLLKIW